MKFLSLVIVYLVEHVDAAETLQEELVAGEGLPQGSPQVRRRPLVPAVKLEVNVSEDTKVFQVRFIKKQHLCNKIGEALTFL